MAKRYSKKTGPAAYAPFFEALRGAAMPRAPAHVHVVASTCSGLTRLSEHLGVTLHHIGCPAAPGRHTEALSRQLYGARVVTNGPDGYAVEDGWEDWRDVALEHEMVGGCPLATGAKLLAGRLTITLDAALPRASFARSLALAMDSMRFDVALTGGRAVACRHRSGASLDVPPRYAGCADDEDWIRANQLYVFDPWRDLARLAALACSAATVTLATADMET